MFITTKLLLVISHFQVNNLDLLIGLLARLIISSDAFVSEFADALIEHEQVNDRLYFQQNNIQNLTNNF